MGNGLPDHDVGTFPNANNPNTISAQNVNTSMVLVPVATTNAAPRGPGGIGYALNGVKFDPATAGSCATNGASTSCSLIGNTGAWSIEALGQSNFNFGVDGNNAHVQPDGTYHYHGMPEGLVSKQAKGPNMTLVGFALDGYPVYARYGYTVASNELLEDSAIGLEALGDPVEQQQAPGALGRHLREPAVAAHERTHGGN